MEILNSIYGEEVNNLAPTTFEKMMKEEKNAAILDVRTHAENILVRIQNSILIDIYKPDFLEKINELDRSKTYFVYCRTGIRSYNASKQMLQMGFEKVYNLETGIISWTGEVEHG